MAVTTKKITTVDTATTFDDVFVNTNGTLKQVPKADFQQASGIATNTEAITTLKDRTKTYDYTLSSGSFLDWVRTTFTTNGVYYVVYATANQNGWIGTANGTCIVEKRNSDIYLTAYYNETSTASNQTIYTNRYISNVWLGWAKLPTRSEIDANTAAIGALNSRTSDTAGFHNGIYRGKNITSYLTNGSLWNRIKGAGGYKLFEDLYLGDYITVGSNSFAIVDFDYYLRCGSVDLNEHHVVMMPVGAMNIPAGTALYGTSESLTFINTANAGVTVTSQESSTAFKWNATMDAPNTNSTNGGYKYSRMRTVVMKAANTIVVNAFGAAHVKPITVIYPNPSDASASGLASELAWFDQDDQSNIMCKSICDLPNETQVYGQQVWGRGSAYTNVGYEIGTDKFQFAIFAFHRNFANDRGYWWLRSVTSASSATNVGGTGLGYYYGSASASGARPRFLLVG